MLPLALLAIWLTNSRGGAAATLVGLTIMVVSLTATSPASWQGSASAESPALS